MGEIKKRPSPVVKGNEGTIRTTVQVKRSDYNFGEQHEPEIQETEQKVTVPLFQTAPAYVRVAASTTKNMGDFNSIKVSVDVSLPCYPEGTEIDRAYDIASSWVNQKIQDELDYARGRAEQGV